jgi:hypothetical protein
VSASDWTTSKASGDRIEHEVVERLPVEYVPDTTAEWYDCRPTDPVTARDVRLGGCALVPSGTPIEIKAARVTLADGERGRYYLRKGQHDRLDDAGGLYLFVVYAPAEDPLRALLLVPADDVARLVPSWIDSPGRATYAQLAWSRLFDPETVEVAP